MTTDLDLFAAAAVLSDGEASLTDNPWPHCPPPKSAGET